MNGVNIYFYKMTVDDGGAPYCTFGRSGLWSLAICKPKIRSTAKKDDIVIGFAGKRLDPSKRYGVVHIAELGTPLLGQEYYARDSRYAKRGDCIYKVTGSDYRRRRDARYHTDEHMDRDLGPLPKRRSARVLVSRKFRFFGRRRFEVDWRKYPALRKRLEALQQGHRVYHAQKLRKELESLVAVLFRQPYLRNLTHDAIPSCGERDDDASGVCGGCAPPGTRKRAPTCLPRRPRRGC